MIAWLLLLLLQPAKPAMPQASMVEWTGRESWKEALQKLNQTGNVVLDGRAARGQPVTVPTLKMNPGKQLFWAALDEVCTQAQLQLVLTNGHIELIAREAPPTRSIAYDGPWRGRIVRRTLIGYDDPKLDRLVCQVELSLEPRLNPLLFTMKSSGAGTHSFDGESSKLIDVRLPAPPRTAQTLEQLVIEGDAWIATSKLTFTLPVRIAASSTTEGTTASVKDIVVTRSSSTWEIATEVQYPAGSLEWESHQARLLSSMKLVLTKGKQQVAEVGREIRTDAGRKVSATWLFRNMPGQPGEWQGVLTAPSSPMLVPVKIEFNKVPLP